MARRCCKSNTANSCRRAVAARSCLASRFTCPSRASARLPAVDSGPRTPRTVPVKGQQSVGREEEPSRLMAQPCSSLCHRATNSTATLCQSTCPPSAASVGIRVPQTLTGGVRGWCKHVAPCMEGGPTEEPASGLWVLCPLTGQYHMDMQVWEPPVLGPCSASAGSIAFLTSKRSSSPSVGPTRPRPGVTRGRGVKHWHTRPLKVTQNDLQESTDRVSIRTASSSEQPHCHPVETSTYPHSNLNEGADQTEEWRSALLQRPGPPANPTHFLLVPQSQSTQNALSPFNGGKVEVKHVLNRL